MHINKARLSATATTAIILAFLSVSGASAQQAEQAPPPVSPGLEPAPLPPDIPPPVQSGEALEPEVTIIESEEERVEQYSIQGRVYMVKITPKRGRPYFLIDSDGDGIMETRRHDLEKVTPNMWVIHSW